MITRLLSSAAVLAVSATAAMADYSITILHTNDFHSRFEPISRFDSGCSDESNAEGKCFGGSARMMTAIETAKARTDNWLLVDGGDQFQGTLYYTYYKGKAAAEMMNKMGYDAMTVGNHEFDDGPEVLKDFASAINFPILMSNADVPALGAAVPKSVIIEKGGERIGLIGLTPEDTDELAIGGIGIDFGEPVAAVQSEVDKLTAEGVNKIVVLSHSGYNVDQRVAAETTGVDIIVGGHDNTLLSNVNSRAKGPYPTMVGDTAIVQAYAYGKYLGELKVVFDDDGVITSAVGEPILLDRHVSEDEATKARVGELGGPLDEIRNKVVAAAAVSIEGDRSVCRVEECQMGNLVADSMLDRVKDQGIQIAFANSGGIRASIDAGDVTMGEVMTVLPFQNTLATFQAKGQTVVDALENGVSQVEDVKGRFLQVAGLTFTWDSSVAPNEGRVTEVLVGGEPIDLEATYGIVTNNFVRNGGDGFKMFVSEAMNAYDFGPDLADVLAEYMAAQGPVSPAVEGRITKK